MSTYTNLHNKLKETINVDYHTRETNQPVKLQNERNEYWGTFKGALDVEDSTIKKTSLSDVTLYGDINIKGQLIGGDISVDVNQLTSLVHELSVKLYNEDDPAKPAGDIVQHAHRLTDLSIAIDELKESTGGDLSAISGHIVTLIDDVKTKLSTAVSAADQQLNEKIDKVNDDLSNCISTTANNFEFQISTLSQDLSGETAARIANDTALSTDFMLALGAEQYARIINDDMLSAGFLSVDENAKDRDKQLSASLESHEVDNAIQFKDLEDRLLSMIECDKHYSIYDNDELIKSYPYELKDFAVNVLNTSVKDALVLNKSNIAVASIVNSGKTSEGKNIFTISFYSIIEDADILQAIDPGNQYELVDGITQPTYKNDYTIAIRDNKLYLVHNYIPYLKLIDVRNGMPVGIIKPYLSTDADGLVSGLIDVDTKTSELSTFNKFHDYTFNNANLSVLSNGNDQIVFSKENKEFTFRAEVFDIHYCTVQDANTSEAFGIIYEGDLSAAGADINAVAMTTDNQKILLQAPKFKTDYALVGNVYNMICCNVGTRVFEKYEVHAKYQYGYYDTTGENRGHVILTAENRELYPLDFETISVKLENTQVSALANQTFELKRIESEILEPNIWKCAVDWPDKDISATIAFNGSIVQLNGAIDGATTLATYKINLEDKSIANLDDAYVLKNRSVPVDWNIYPETIESCAASYTIAYQKPSREDILNDVTCQISADNLSSVDFIAPQGQTGVAREFILDTCISTLYPTKVKLNVESICKCKDPIQVEFNGLNAIEISSNTKMLLQFQEVESHKFIVTDLNSNFLKDGISILSNSLSGLSDAVTISVENLQSQINANDADIDYLSSKTSFLLSTDKEHVAYQGTMSQYVPEDPGLTADYYLSTFISQSLNPDFKGHLKLGFMFRLSAEQKDLVDANREKIWFGANDYFIINRDVMVEDILTSDIDIIRDAQGEFTYLSNQITSQISVTSVLLSATDEYLSGQLSTTITNVGEISTAVALSTESISACIELSVNKIQSQIISNDNDIANLQEQVLSAQISVDNLSILVSELSNGLSTDTSVLSEHYGRTFEKDVPIEITGKTISADLLKLTDENKNGKQYTLHLSAGTLVLIPIQ